ncbi:hypothetical protein ABZ915_43500 [Streptomyces sp. NPDC046915]|uniref:hypothetical protein n=1 Tax=Streptomyces sp. NPDC046915 TaxID=3155257 RepID=UPI0034103FF5
MISKRAAVAATAVCALTTAGCGAGEASGHSADPIVPAIAAGLPHALVGSDYNSVSFLETQTQNGTITGTLDDTEVKYNSPEHQRAIVTGTLKGAQVTLTVKFTLGTTVLNGTLDGDALTLQVPQSDGQIEDYVLKPGSVDDYNQHVAELESGGSPSPTAQSSKKFY